MDSPNHDAAAEPMPAPTITLHVTGAATFNPAATYVLDSRRGRNGVMFAAQLLTSPDGKAPLIAIGCGTVEPLDAYYIDLGEILYRINELRIALSDSNDDDPPTDAPPSKIIQLNG